MKTNLAKKKVPARFRRETYFEIAPRFDSLAASDAERGKFEKLKSTLLKPVLDDTLSPALRKQLRLAANEAAAVAWTTPFPLLVLPVLLEEKAEEVQEYVRRQEQVQQASHFLFTES